MNTLIRLFKIPDDPLGQPSRSELRLMRWLYLWYFAGFGIFFPYINVYYRDIGLSGVQIGLINTLLPLVGIGSGLFWGMLCDKFGITRRILLLTTIGIIISALAIAASYSYLWLILWVIAYSFFYNAQMPLMDGLTLNLLGKYRHYYGRIRTWGTIGFVVSSSIFGYVLNSQGLHWLFYGYVAALTLYLIFLFRLPASRAYINVSIWKSLTNLVSNSAWLIFAGSLVLLGIANFGMNTFLGIYVKELGGNESLIGVAFSLGALSEVPIMLMGNALLSRFGSHKLLLFSYVIYVLRMYCYSVMPTAMWVVPISILNGLSFGLFWISIVTYASELAPSYMRATAQGTMVAVLNVANVLAGMVGGWFYDQIGSAYLYRLYSGFALMALVILLVQSLIRKISIGQG